MQSLPSLLSLPYGREFLGFPCLLISPVYQSFLVHLDFQGFPWALMGLWVQMVPPFLVAPALRLVRRGPEDHDAQENLAGQTGPGLQDLPLVPCDQALRVETVRWGPVVPVVPLSLGVLVLRVDPLDRDCRILLYHLVVP